MSRPRALSLLMLAALLGGAPAAAQPADKGVSALRDPAKLVARARQLEERGDLAGAMTFYDAALAIDPQNGPALQAAGENALSRGDGPLAHGYFSALAAAQPKNPDAQFGLAAALVLRQQPEQAQAALVQATALGLPRARSVALAGLLRDLSGDLRGAQVDYAEALAANPKDLQAGQRLAVSLAASGDRAAALRTMRGFGTEGLDRFEVRRTLALVHALTGDLATANEIAATILSPGEAEILGRFLARLPSLAPRDKLRAAHYGILPSAPVLAQASPTPPPPAPSPQPAASPPPAAPAPAALPAPVVLRPERPSPPPAAVPLAQPGGAARIWVQLASAPDPAALGGAWRRIRGTGALQGKLPYVQRRGPNHRLLAGPFDSLAAAQAAVARLKTRRIDALALATAAGADIRALPGT